MNNDNCKICQKKSVKKSRYCLDCMPRLEFMYYDYNSNIIFILYLGLLILFLSIMFTSLRYMNEISIIGAISTVIFSLSLLISGLIIYIVLDKING
ncbi:MAG: hypothetical protein LN408_03330 [Candidatus Thermoplasmatota archaeon]|nr:hypothetical protein [Candidatus Thermoplasmatota archaeon]